MNFIFYGFIIYRFAYCSKPERVLLRASVWTCYQEYIDNEIKVISDK